jgi:hypothetical protein
MSQPKSSPTSVRFGEGRLDRIDAYAKAHLLNRHLAILVLVDAGLAVGKPAACEPARTVEPRRMPVKAKLHIASEDGVQIGPMPSTPGSRLKKR